MMMEWKDDEGGLDDKGRQEGCLLLKEVTAAK